MNDKKNWYRLLAFLKYSGMLAWVVGLTCQSWAVPCLRTARGKCGNYDNNKNHDVEEKFVHKGFWGASSRADDNLLSNISARSNTERRQGIE
jgi:hypothetical protein